MQAPVKLGQQATGVDDVETASETNSKFTLPIANLHAYIARKNQEASDDDDWEE
jgi:hypothetical protein